MKQTLLLLSLVLCCFLSCKKNGVTVTPSVIPVVPVVPVAVVPDTITYTLTTPAINNYTIAYVDSNGSVQKVNFSGTNWTKVITRGKYVLGVEFYAFEPVPFVNSVATISIQVNGIVKKTLTYKFNTNNAIEAILSYEF